jgi:hypothetical protein
MYSEMNLTRFAALDQRPRLADMERRFRGTKLLAIVGSLLLTFVILIVWPAVTVSAGVMDFVAFTRWVSSIFLSAKITYFRGAQEPLCGTI